MLSPIANGIFDSARAARRHHVSPIEEECAWRHSNHLRQSQPVPTLAVGRWSEVIDGPHEFTASPLDEHYTIEVLLGSTSIDCSINGRTIVSGPVHVGATQVTAPSESVYCRFKRSIEAIHVFIPRLLVVSSYEELTQRSCPGGFELNDPQFNTDAPTATLARALADARVFEGPYAALYSDSISLALLARVMALDIGPAESRFIRSGLVPWRQRRVIEFIDANLAKPITLRELAEQAGLSRMYFAAQFKLATGLTPHAYLLNRRIDYAKLLMRTTDIPLIQIALEVGFQSHAHFTTVFRKFTGTTPGRWRCEIQTTTHRAEHDEQEAMY